MGNQYTIGNVTIDLSYYSGENKYSDGDIELEILKMAQNEALDEHSILAADHRWAVLYHFSSVRRNLLEWIPLEKNSHILEIGAGCGALTGLLSEKASRVTAVELSKLRAEIIANRHKECSNIDIIVGNFEDIQFEEKFDYITLIGVLEYSGKFINTSTPYESFLKQIHKLLKPGGKLIIAIENKFGLKYWAGAREDHLGTLYEGIEDYPSHTGIRTFSHKELNSLLDLSGFETNDFYYPWPDYKFPDQIFSDDYLPQVGQINYPAQLMDQSRFITFDEQKVGDGILDNDIFPFFSNSFLVISTKEHDDEDHLF